MAEIFITVGKLFRNREYREHVVSVYLIFLYLLYNLNGIVYHLRVLREQRTHFLLRLKILLLGVSHTVRIIIVGIGGKTDKAVMGRAVLLTGKMGIISCHNLYTQTLTHLKDLCVCNLLQICHLCGHSGDLCTVQLYLQIVILTKKILIPKGCFLSLLNVACIYKLRDLTSQTCRATDKVLVIFLKCLAVNLWFVIETLSPTG